MKRKIRILDHDEKNEIYSLINNQFHPSDLPDQPLSMSGKKKVWMVSSKLASANLKGFSIQTMGVYLGSKDLGGLRLSIEGSQIIGPQATKSIVELDDQQVLEWMSGMAIKNKNLDLKGFVLIRWKNDFLGCGLVKNDKIVNLVPKERLLHRSSSGKS